VSEPVIEETSPEEVKKVEVHLKRRGRKRKYIPKSRRKRKSPLRKWNLPRNGFTGTGAPDDRDRSGKAR
jgi:hypothetical protein